MIWNSHATQLMMNFNKQFTNEGLMMEGSLECDHPVIIRVLHLLNYIASKTADGVVAAMVEAGCKQEEVAIVLDEFMTHAFFLLALLGRNEAARKTIVKFRGVTITLSFLSNPSNSTIWKLEDPTICQCYINGCFALGQILTSVTDHDGSFKQRCIDSNIIPTLYSMIKAHSSEPQCAQYIFFAMGNLAYVCDIESELLEMENKEDKNWIDWAITCLEIHGIQNPLVHVMSDVLFFLKNLAFGERGKEQMLKMEVMQLTFKILSNKRDYPDLIDQGMNLLFDMTFQKGMLTQLCENTEYFNDKIRFTLSLIKQHRAYFGTIQQCIRFLTRIYVNCENSLRAFMIKEGYTNCLIFLHTTFRDDPEKLKLVESIFIRLSRVACPTRSGYYLDDDVFNPFVLPSNNAAPAHNSGQPILLHNANAAFVQAIGEGHPAPQNNANAAIAPEMDEEQPAPQNNANADLVPAMGEVLPDARNDNMVSEPSVYSLKEMAARRIRALDMMVSIAQPQLQPQEQVQLLAQAQAQLLAQLPPQELTQLLAQLPPENQVQLLAQRQAHLKDLLQEPLKTQLRTRGVPDDLVTYLTSAKKCDLCYKSFFAYWHEITFSALFTPMQQQVPLHWNLCSAPCLARLLRSLPMVSQASIVRSNGTQ
jgi:hypothetical protein